jgi:hypothetical protein
LNERTGTPFNDLEFPTDIVLLVFFWDRRYTLSIHDVAEMCLEWGFIFMHETVRDWEDRFAPVIADQLRTCATWSSREHPGMWMRPLSKCMENGALSLELVITTGTWSIHGEAEKRDRDAAQQVSKQARAVVGHAPAGNDRRRSFLSPCSTRNARI